MRGFDFCTYRMKGFVNTMRNLRIHSLLGLLILVLAACASKFQLPPNPMTSQPDLIINFMYLEMEGRQGNCVDAYSPYGIRVQIKNIGSANTGPFLVDLNGILQEVKDGLLIGESIELHFAGTISSGQYEATADVTDQVVESLEDNNTFSFQAPTPTPPPLCVATVTAIP